MDDIAYEPTPIESPTGSPQAARRYQRWRMRVQVGVPDECWPWTGPPHNGYGNHRATYELFVGPIPKGYSVDHLCEMKLCQNPAHLEAVTIIENALRWHRNRGHGRHCKTCTCLDPIG